MTVETTFAVSGQHYLFNVQTFAHTVLALGGDAYAYALRDRTTQGVIDDVAGGKSDLGVLFQTSATADEVNWMPRVSNSSSSSSRRRAWRCRRATRW